MQIWELTIETNAFKRKVEHQASIGGPPVTVASTLGSSLSHASPSASTAPLRSANVSPSFSSGKGKEVEAVHDVGTDKRRKLKSRPELEGETVKVGVQAQAWRDVERHAREKAEPAEEEQRQLRLRLKKLET